MSCTGKECLLSNALNVLEMFPANFRIFCTLRSELDRILNFSLKWTRQNKLFTSIEQARANSDCLICPSPRPGMEGAERWVRGCSRCRAAAAPGAAGGAARRSRSSAAGAGTAPFWPREPGLHFSSAAHGRERRAPGRRLRPARSGTAGEALPFAAPRLGTAAVPGAGLGGMPHPWNTLREKLAQRPGRMEKIMPQRQLLAHTIQ